MKTNEPMKTAWRWLGWDAVLIGLLTFVVYIPAMRGGFIWDDAPLITENRMIRAKDGLRRFWLTTEAMDYWPLTSTLWWLEWRLWDGRATGYHVVNVLLHAINAVLVWMILRRLKVPGGWLAGLLFAVHPVNVASVVWISEQKNTLSMLFYAVAILLYLRFDEDSGLSREGSWHLPRSGRGWYGLSLVAFLLALLSKTGVVMLPVVLLGCVWWRRNRIGRDDLVRSLPFFGLSLALGLTTVWFQYHRGSGAQGIRMTGFAARLAAAGWGPWFYLYKALLPLNLMAVYPRWQIDAARWIAWLPGTILVGCAGLFWWNRCGWGRPLLFGLGYFVMMLVPVLGFFQQGFHRMSLVADQWQYYSIAGVIALVAAGARMINRPNGYRTRIAGVLASAVVLLLLGVATWSRSCVYADDQAFWKDNLARNPKSWAAHTGLGYCSLRAGRVEEAIGHYEQALRINPDCDETHNNLGIALLRAGRVQEAIGQYEAALGINRDFAWAHYNLGVALARLGKMQEAIEHWEQAVRINPDYVEARNELGIALTRAGRHHEAIKHWQYMLRRNPDFAWAHYNLGLALEQAGSVQEAMKHYQQALRISPDFAEAQSGLARLHAVQ